MTLLVSWIGADNHGVDSAYFASDSRLSWNDKANSRFDYGRKVFASSTHPDIFAYDGDSLFPTIVLSQAVDMIDAGILFPKGANASQKIEIVKEKISHSFLRYPKGRLGCGFEIFHISRDENNINFPSFRFGRLVYSKKMQKWISQNDDVSGPSRLLGAFGSGSLDFNQRYEKYSAGPNKGTSRNIFQCFMASLFSNAFPESLVGGPPQLVGIYRKPKSVALNFGVIYRKKRYFLGLEVPKGEQYDNIYWHNRLFENCDGVTKQRKQGAASQPDPLFSTI
jgi:hypothetical protein